MKKARMLGNFVKCLADKKGLSVSELGRILGFSEERVNAFFKGRVLISFEQVKALANAFNVSIEELFVGDENCYNSTVVHCMNAFDNPDNREVILDIIDDYVDILDAVNLSK